MKLCMQCKLCGKCGKPYSANSNYAETCKDFQSKETNENYYVDCKKILTELESRLAQYKKELHCKSTEINEGCVLNRIKTETKIGEIKNLIDLIKSQNKVDVEIIRHGKPISVINDIWTEKTPTVCSVCGLKISKKDNWCRHCGAILDKT